MQPRPESLGDFPIRDPRDAWALVSALVAGAEVLITGDSDFLDVEILGGSILMTVVKGLVVYEEPSSTRPHGRADAVMTGVARHSPPFTMPHRHMEA